MELILIFLTGLVAVIAGIVLFVKKKKKTGMLLGCSGLLMTSSALLFLLLTFMAFESVLFPSLVVYNAGQASIGTIETRLGAKLPGTARILGGWYSGGRDWTELVKLEIPSTDFKDFLCASNLDLSDSSIGTSYTGGIWDDGKALWNPNDLPLTVYHGAANRNSRLFYTLAYHNRPDSVTVIYYAWGRM